MSLLDALHQQYRLILYTGTHGEIGMLCMCPKQGQLLKGAPHCTHSRELVVELFDIRSYTCMLWFRHVTSLHAVSLEECL